VLTVELCDIFKVGSASVKNVFTSRTAPFTILHFGTTNEKFQFGVVLSSIYLHISAQLRSNSTVLDVVQHLATPACASYPTGSVPVHFNAAVYLLKEETSLFFSGDKSVCCQAEAFFHP